MEGEAAFVLPEDKDKQYLRVEKGQHFGILDLIHLEQENGKG